MRQLTRRILGALLLIAASPLVAPQLLAFPYYAEIGNSRVWSERPIDRAALARVVARSEALVSQSPIAHDREPRSIFMTDGGWRWLWLANTARGTFAMTRLVGQNLLVNRGDPATDRIRNDRAVGGERSLSAVIAHETTHGMLLRRFGPVRTITSPRWMVEGYCDHVAQDSALTDEEAARLEARGEDHPALLYFHGRKRVEAMLRQNGGDVDALFRAN